MEVSVLKNILKISVPVTNIMLAVLSLSYGFFQSKIPTWSIKSETISISLPNLSPIWN